MSYQQILKADGTVDPNVIQFTDANGVVWRDIKPGIHLWQDYQAWLAAGNQPDAAVQPDLDTVRKSLAEQLDNYVASVYSNWTRFQAEYQAREAAATAFRAVNYAGDPGPYVSSYATAAGITNVQACDAILVQATAMNNALSQIGALRMQKYLILQAPTVQAANDKYNQLQVQITTVAAVLQ